MSEVALLPFDSRKKTTFEINDNIITGTGEVVCPFTMINITDQSYLSDVKSQGYEVFASNMPLDGGLYWLMYIKCDLDLGMRYFQSQQLFENATFEIYFRTCKKPLVLGNMSSTRKLPKMTSTQVVRIGKIPEIEIVTALNMYGVDYITINRTLTLEEISKLIITKNEYCKGVPWHVLYPNG